MQNDTLSHGSEFLFYELRRVERVDIAIVWAAPCLTGTGRGRLSAFAVLPDTQASLSKAGHANDTLSHGSDFLFYEMRRVERVDIAIVGPHLA
jgi:hypothetical protein